MNVTVTITTSPEGIDKGDPVTANAAREQVVLQNTENNPQKINMTIGGKTYTFMTAELGQAIMKASLIHG